MDKKNLSERDICTKFITPALRKAGWDEMTQIREEVGLYKGRKETERAWKVIAEEVKARGYNLDIKNPHTREDDHGDPEELLAKLAATEAETASLRDQLKAILAKALLR